MYEIAVVAISILVAKGSIEMTNCKNKRVPFSGFAIELPKGPIPVPVDTGRTSGEMTQPAEMPPVVRSAYKKWRKKLKAGSTGPSPDV
jgi:hypothetical protein